ncbi:hypothetical protein [Massilia luteola]|uniref:acyltransferase n=1 Tax=Massilia luteola TaxID=3081751 RepID=UPI002ACBF6FD|nr:hypothetical protein [Massilia sp. Gc5]
MSNNLNIIGPGKVFLGERTRVAPDVQFIFHEPSQVVIGDYCVIGSGVKFVCNGGNVAVGDWTSIHDRSLVLSTVGVQIGQHGWFGQHCILDGSGGLTIGNGVRVGMYSQIWSHVAAGEQIEGCTLYGERPVVLEDDVWLVGSCIVASGVTLGKKLVALIASNITKSWPANSVLAGSPAAPKSNLSFYREISLDEKWTLLNGWLNEISQTNGFDIQRNEFTTVLSRSNGTNVERIGFAIDQNFAQDLLKKIPQATVCDITNKTYSKRLSDIEAIVLKNLAGNKARFINLSE